MAKVHRASKEFLQEKMLRSHKLELLRESFPTLSSFVSYVLHELWGWSPTKVQREMLDWVDEKNPQIMLQMPRSQGKTLLLAIVAVYELILDPTWRVVVFAGGKDLAMEISEYIRQIFKNLPVLDFMAPSHELDDKDSSENFSITSYLRPLDKSPSVKCRPIGGSFAGIRADTILGDDLERETNARSLTGRETLAQAITNLSPLLDGTKKGQRIILAGTPQSRDSVYNSLPAQGFLVRIWPVRVPNNEEIEYYGANLAPSVAERYIKYPEQRSGYGLTGKRGALVDPERFSEEMIVQREQAMSRNGTYDLQYQLNTTLSDKLRYPIKLHDVLLMDVPATFAPLSLNTIRVPSGAYKAPEGFSVPQTTMYEVQGTDTRTAPYQSMVIYIDPSGGGKTSRDEVGFACSKALNGYVYVDRVTGFAGGYSEENMNSLCDMIEFYWSQSIPMTVYVEDNYGNGMFRQMLQGRLTARRIHVALQGDTVSGQKETRIISTLEPLLRSGRLIFNKSIVEEDILSIQKYSAIERNTYSLFHQMKYITHERNSLKHDDRIDALAGCLKFFADQLVTDQNHQREQAEKEIKMTRIRELYRDRADEVLKALGYLGAQPSAGRNHTSFGIFKHKDNSYGQTIPEFKSPAEQTRWENEQARKRVAESSTYSRTGRTSRAGRGGRPIRLSGGYFKRK